MMLECYLFFQRADYFTGLSRSSNMWFAVKHFFNREKDQKFTASEDGANLNGKIANPSSFVKVEGNEGVMDLRNPEKDGKFDSRLKPAAKGNLVQKYFMHPFKFNLVKFSFSSCR